MIQAHKQYHIRNKAAGNERIRKIVNRHREIVDVNCFVYIEFFCFDLLLGSRFRSEGAHVEFAVVHVGDRVFVSLRVLFHLFELDVLLRVAADFFFEGQAVGFQGVLFDPVFLVGFFSDSDGAF